MTPWGKHIEFVFEEVLCVQRGVVCAEERRSSGQDASERQEHSRSSTADRNVRKTQEGFQS